MSMATKPIHSQPGGRGKLYGGKTGGRFEGTYFLPNGKLDRKIFKAHTNTQAIAAYDAWCTEMDKKLFETMKEVVKPEAKAKKSGSENTIIKGQEVYTVKYRLRAHCAWTEEEDALVLAHTMPDSELSKQLQRSVKGIQNRRSRLKKQTMAQTMLPTVKEKGENKVSTAIERQNINTIYVVMVVGGVAVSWCENFDKAADVCDALTAGAKASGFAAKYDVVEVKKWTA